MSDVQTKDRISDSFARVALAQVKVRRDRRQRRVVNTDGLRESIAKHGVLSPIVLERDYTLVFGERRYTASCELGLLDIPVRFVESLTPVELQILELEENAKRSDLCWQDMVRAVAHIHELHLRSDAGWTQGETADSIGMSQTTVSMYFRVNSELDDERISGASTVQEAYNVLKRRDQRSAGDELQKLLEITDEVMAGGAQTPSNVVTLPTAAGTDSPQTHVVDFDGKVHALAPAPQAPRGLHYPPPEDSILHESFLQWAPRYEGRKFNLIHCDFPYGINLFAGPQSGRAHQTYDDSKDIYFALLECLCTNLDRLMGVSGHLMFWYSEKHGDATRRMFRELAPSLAFQKFPLIWTKTDNAGISANPSQDPRHVYETCLLASRGSRNLVKIASDWYGCPTDKALHISTKPEPMLKHFMSMLVDSGTHLLDPTCGSAAALRAAEALGASRVLGMDVDEQTVGVSRLALKNARALRIASRSI
jgi:ParB/RepB/Spo0J family partition protein